MPPTWNIEDPVCPLAGMECWNYSSCERLACPRNNITPIDMKFKQLKYVKRRNMIWNLELSLRKGAENRFEYRY